MKNTLTIILVLLGFNLYSQSGLDLNIISYDNLYKVDGKIGKSEIELCYRLNEKSISGFYYYKKYLQKINILGFISNDTISIYEFDQEVNKAGKFIGYLESDSTCIGNWENLATNKTYSFKLTGKHKIFHDYTGYLQITHESKHRLYRIDSMVFGAPYLLKILDRHIIDNYTYFLLRTDGYEGSPDNLYGPCGGGISQVIICAQVDQKGNLIWTSSIRVSSCFDNITCDNIDGEWLDKRYFKIACLKNDKNYIFQYDRNVPKKGFKLIDK